MAKVTRNRLKQLKMTRKAKLMFSLSRGRVRASWNKYNLFNLYKKPQVSFQGKNSFQQQFLAKQESRAYHGEYLPERILKSKFTENLESVAHLDASLRGEERETPIKLQTYAFLEKRLDFAIHRAMFASSLRQARQFIIGGHVWVNNVKIKQPGYTLSPGDIFHVNPDKVLFATGLPRPHINKAITVDKISIALWNKFAHFAKASPRKAWDQEQARNKKIENETKKQGADADLRAAKIEQNMKLDNQMLEEQRLHTLEKMLFDVMKTGLKVDDEKLISKEVFASLYSEQVSNDAVELFKSFNSKHKLTKDTSEEQLKTIIYNHFVQLEKIDLNEDDKKFNSLIRKNLSLVRNNHLEDIRKRYAELKKKASNESLESNDEEVIAWAESLKIHPKLNREEILANDGKYEIDLPDQKAPFGRLDPSKEYFTPWKPRQFLAPFAILPSHLEISFKTCHAVYLRDPVALPGKSEVITPLDVSVHERAYMYYIRRHKRERKEYA